MTEPKKIRRRERRPKQEPGSPPRPLRRRQTPLERLDSCGRPILLSEEQRTRKALADCVAWTAPAEMPDYVCLDVMNGVVCGAVVRRGKGDDRYCRSKPTQSDRTKPTPWRCPKHGGESRRRATAGPGNAQKYGLYTDALFEHEKELWTNTKADSVDEEIVNAKIRLRRALIAEKDAQLGLVEMTEEDGPDGAKVKKRFANMNKLVDQILAQLARLYALRSGKMTAILEATSEGVKVYLPSNGRET